MRGTPAIRLGTCCSFCLRRSFLPKSSFASASFLLCFQVSAETSLLKIFQTLPSLPTERVRLCFAMVCHGRFAQWAQRGQEQRLPLSLASIY